MTNFDYFKKEKKFDSFVDVAIVAEKIIYIDTATSVVNCRRAMEFAIKWLYSVDSSLEMPYQDNLLKRRKLVQMRQKDGSRQNYMQIL